VKSPRPRNRHRSARRHGWRRATWPRIVGRPSVRPISLARKPPRRVVPPSTIWIGEDLVGLLYRSKTRTIHRSFPVTPFRALGPVRMVELHETPIRALDLGRARFIVDAERLVVAHFASGWR
jgi:hypothetical protein